jgi:O-methyltransferase
MDSNSMGTNFNSRFKRKLGSQAKKVAKLKSLSKLIPYLAEPYELVQGPLTYNQDGLATRHNCDFMHDKLFQESYSYGKSTGSWNGSWGEADIQWRAYVACWAANKAKNLEGDFVECGVNRGGLARTIIHYVNFNDLGKKFYLLDTFQGLSEKYITEKEKARGRKPGGYEECYDAVKETFREFNVEIIKGMVPDTLVQVKADKVCYLSIDMNCVMPEVAAVEFFWDKLVSGGVVVLDDYGWPGHIEQKVGLDKVAAERSVQVLALPTGQGLIFKP